jgi:tetratricopeptide (TPR) repeat protein
MDLDYDFLRKHSHSNNDYQIAYNRGKFAMDHNDFEGALVDFSQSIDLNAAFEPAYEMKLHCLSKLKRFEAAIPIAEKLCVLNPKSDKRIFDLGMCQFKTENYEKAKICFLKTIDLNPNNFWAYFRKGECNHKLKLKYEAFFDFTKCIELDSDYFGSYFIRGQVRGELFDEIGAINDFRIVLNKMPDDSLTIFNMGVSYFNLRNKEKAQFFLKKALNQGIMQAKPLLEQMESFK